MTGVYYFDVLPAHPQPELLESLTSYLARLAVANQLRSMWQLLTLCFPNDVRPRLTIHNRDFPPVSFGTLPIVAQCSETDLLATTFSHLVQKFGRPPYSRGFARFFSGVLAHQLRYCPLCLAEHGYYRLTWRFLPIEGCHEHGCYLLDRCGHCGQPVPFLTYLPQWGICPTCAGDLRTCPVERLDELQHTQVKTRTYDFEYLLCPQPYEKSGEQLIKMIGDQFARWREHQGLSIAEVARAMKQNPPMFSYLENGSSPRGLGFRKYLNYADFLQISLRDIFETPAPGPSPAQSYEEKTLAKIRQAIVVLEQQEQRVTQTKVSQMIRVNMSVFIKYPQIKAFWAEYRASVRARWEQDMMNQIDQAVAYLRQRGQPVTKTAVCQLIDQNLDTLRLHPTIWAHIASHSERTTPPRRPSYQKKRPVAQGRVYRREAELIDKVQQAIEQLQREGKQVSQYAIADLVGMSTDGLIYYPQVRAILRANKAEPKRPQDETLLLAQVQQAVVRLEDLNARVSRAAVARQVGLSACTLKYYPQVNSFLTEQVARYQRQQAEKQRQRETELVSQAQQAITLLAVSGNRLTQTAIREMIGLSLSQLQQYPRLKALIQEATQPGGSARHL